MTIRQAIDDRLDELLRAQVRAVWEFTRSLAGEADPDAAMWREAGKRRLAEAFDADEPVHTEAMVKPELDT